MNLKSFVFSTTVGLCACSVAQAALYTADFSTAGIGWTHTTALPLAPGPQSVAGVNFTLSYPGNPLSDTTINSFITVGGNLSASDWGGDGRFVTSTIDVSGEDAVTITTAATGTFNTPPGENFIWFYSLDGGTPVTSSKSSGSLSQVWTEIDTSAASALVVGFTFNHNGSDGFTVSSVVVEAVPEPGSAVLGAIGLLGLLRRRR